VLNGVKGANSTEVWPYDYDARRRIDRNITDLAVSYIQARGKDMKPFFLYVPFTLPHSPPLPHPDLVDPNRSQYQNALGEIDFNSGRIIDAVDSSGLTKNTIVVWTSDNGPETLSGITVDFGAQSDSGPFRGEFPSAWEGAIRTPCIVRWPGYVAPGSVSNEIVSILDFYRTFANVIGASHLVPTDRPIDSIDQSGFLFGRQAKSNRDALQWFLAGDRMAMKYSRFKVHFCIRESSRGSAILPGQPVYGSPKVKLPDPWVFDLENDPKELWNIAAMNPWLGHVLSPTILGYEKSIRVCPNIPPGSSTCPWMPTPSFGDEPKLQV
jgi:arylsulfatase